MDYILVANKGGSTEQTKQVKAKSDFGAIETARQWKTELGDGSLVQVAIALPDGTPGTVVGTTDYILRATSKVDDTVQTRPIDATTDSEALELGRRWKCSMFDGFDQLVEVAIAMPGGTPGLIVGTVA